MNIEESKKLKQEAEQKILEIITAFEQTTGLCVAHINHESVRRLLNSAITISVELDVRI